MILRKSIPKTYLLLILGLILSACTKPTAIIETVTDYKEGETLLSLLPLSPLQFLDRKRLQISPLSQHRWRSVWPLRPGSPVHPGHARRRRPLHLFLFGWLFG
jgi:hypothetical protein